jgi:alpha-N-acetylglucosaminidase
MKQRITYTPLFFLLLLASAAVHAQQATKEAMALIKRTVGQRANSFVAEMIPATAGRDSFEIEAKAGKIILRGNNAGAIGSALYAYLTDYCHSQITWNGTRISLPVSLPKPDGRIARSSPYEHRYYMNYCTFNYSMSWWDWSRWEKEIDWMALHGINMPLAITGEEYTWYLVYRDMGFTDEDLKDFFSGPAYFSWFWMGNIDGWGGPLPQSWMKSHFELQKKVIARERALGMKPVLPAFTGHVPAAFKKKFPNAKLKTSNWHNGFGDTYILDAGDPMFASIGKKFLEKQTALLGTDHYYSADTFNENEPASDEPAFLSELSAKVYEGMHAADTAAIWVMQGWLFFSDRKFWKDPQTEALLKAVPNDKMMILDLATEIEPVWKRTQAFYGKPWIWNMINNFGGNTNLFGRMDVVASQPAAALQDPASGKLSGIGLTMEGIEQNPAVYELMLANTWRRQPINLDDWIKAYVHNRYGVADENALRAWDILRNTVYRVPADKYIRDGAESILQGRPTFDSLTKWTKTKLNYLPADLVSAWDALIKAAPRCGTADGFQFDIVDLTRQVLANYALPLQQQFVRDFRAHNAAAFKKHTAAFIELITDMDKLLATRKDFLLGPWLADAVKWGKNDAEKRLYEMNARDLVTLWGGADNVLHEYACRQWSGLLNDFYKPRWDQFFALANQSLDKGTELDINSFQQTISQWEWRWVNETKQFPTQPTGDPVAIATSLYQKYRDAAVAAFAQ